MGREGKRCVIYSRVSTEMQIDGYSLAAQRNSLLRYVDREEMICVKEYEDAGKSGKSIEGRPSFQMMLEDIQNGLEIDYVIVYKLSRFGRNAADVLNSLELIQDYDVNLICTDEGIDSSQASGRLLISVLSAVAEIERENIIEQTMNGRKEKARQGKWNGGFAPYGYKLINGKLEIVEEEAVAVRIIFDKFVNENYKYTEISNYLNLQGIKKVPKSWAALDYWDPGAIKKIIQNPIHCGIVAYGRRSKQKVKGTKNQYRMVPQKEFITAEGIHEPIIDSELYDKAIEKIGIVAEKYKRKRPNDQYHPLSGLLECPICGANLTLCICKWEKNKKGVIEKDYYHCRKRNRYSDKINCGYKGHYFEEEMEKIIIAVIKIIVTNKEYITKIKSLIGNRIDTTKLDNEIANYQKKLKEVQQNKSYLENEIDNFPLDVNHREQKLKDLNRRLDKLYDTIQDIESAISEIKKQKASVEKRNITEENLYKILMHFDLLYNKLENNERKKLLHSLIKRIHVYKKEENSFPIKAIEFNFPINKKGKEIKTFNFDESNIEECYRYFVGNHLGQGLDFKVEIGGEQNQILIEDVIKMIPKEEKEVVVTYPLIKKYVKEKYGFNVHNVYIAHVKDMFGLEKRKNYNLGNNKSRKVSFENKEKIDAVIDALKYYGEIK